MITINRQNKTGFTQPFQERNGKERAGFTLIEVIIATTIFAIGIVSIFPLFSGSVAMLADMRARNVMSQLAGEKISGIEAQGFQETPATISRTSFPDPHGSFAYQINWSPVAYDVTSPSDIVLYQATLTMYWPSRSGEKSDTFITYLSRMNPY